MTVSAGQSDALSIDKVDALPESFVLRGIDARRSFPISDADLTDLDEVGNIESLLLPGQRALSAALLERLMRGPSLKELDLANTSITDASLDLMSRLSGLTRLDLSFTSVTDTGLRRLGVCKELRSLALVATLVGNEGIEDLGELKQLEELDLSGTHVTDQGLACLRNLTGLTNLRLDHSAIGDAALHHLSGCRKLTHLSLMHCRVSDEGAMSLAKLNNLKELCVVGTGVTRGGLNALCQALPNCTTRHEMAPFVDLLSLISAERHSVRGKWLARQGLLAVEQSQNVTNARIQIPVSPPEEYVLRATVKQETKASGLLFGIIVSGRQCGVVVDDWAQKGSLTGIDLIDGRRSPENESATVGQVFYRDGEPANVTVTVRNSRVTVACNGKVRVDWKGDAGRLAVHPPYSVPNKTQLFLGTYNGQFRISRLTLTPISGTTEISQEPKR